MDENKIINVKKKIEENNEILSAYYNFDKLKELKLLKYDFTLKAKNRRDFLIITNAIALILTVMLSFVTFWQTVVKASYEDGDKIIQGIDNYKIDENASEEKTEVVYKEIKSILSAEIYVTKEKLHQSEKLSEMVLNIMIGFIILIIATYIILIKTFSGRAAYYETLVIMIDERINEIKAGSWEKAQKVKIKVEDGIKVVDDVKIKGSVKIQDNITIRY